MSIKKQFVELHTVLSANAGKKVKDIMDLLEPLMEAHEREKASFTDEHGLWVFCWYHKQWELTKQVEYGSKVNTLTGLNTMCKVGVNQWTKQQREYKKAKAELLDQVAAGTLEVSKIQEATDELEWIKDRVKPLLESHWEEALEDARQAG